MKQYNLYCATYTICDAQAKAQDKTIYVCAMGMKDAVNIALEILSGKEIKHIQRCKIKPFVGL